MDESDAAAPPEEGDENEQLLMRAARLRDEIERRQADGEYTGDLAAALEAVEQELEFRGVPITQS